MSLDVSQRLWVARRDPKRRTASIGTYTHLSNTGSLIYDQPLILGVMALYGSAASGDPVYRAGVALGKLLRSIYLCDYFISEPFRREINRILVHGESVHELQRAIYRGSFSKPRGKREPELIAISGSLTLVSNLCLAWTTTKMQEVINSRPAWIREAGTEWLNNVSPGQFSNINLDGTFSFRFDGYRDRLLNNIEKSKSAK